jgi:hypothetical protein
MRASDSNVARSSQSMQEKDRQIKRPGGMRHPASNNYLVRIDQVEYLNSGIDFSSSLVTLRMA